MCTMASWVPATRIVKGSMTLKKFVDTHKLEKIVTVTGGHYATSTKYDFSEGQVLKLIRKDSIIVVRTCKIDGAAGEVVQRNEEPVTIPRDFNGELEVVPMSSDTFRCKVVDQLFKRPLPLYITPTVAFKIGEVTIEAGTGLKILKTNVSPTSETTLECIQLKDGNKIKIPLGTFGQFKLRWEKHYVTVNDIYDRLPQKVKTTMMRGCNIAEPFPGLPANHVGPFYLDKIDVVEVAIRGSKDKPSLIPVSLDIHVQQSDVKINDFNPGVNIHKLIHTSSANLPMVVQVTNDNKGAIPGIEPGSKLVIHRVQRFEAVLATTDTNQDIMIPCSYKGGFERVPAVFETAEDMWIGAKNKYVQATERYRSENIDLYSVATGDILKPTNMLRVTLSGENEERDVLLCHKYQPDRQASVVKIPLYARCMFKEVVLDEGNETEHTINEITHLFGTPLLVRPSKITSDCEAMSVLTAKTPITLGDKFDYSLIAVSKYPDNDSPCFAIPEFTELIVRELDVTVTKKPHSVSPSLQTLNKEQVGRIKNDIMYLVTAQAPPIPPPQDPPQQNENIYMSPVPDKTVVDTKNNTEKGGTMKSFWQIVKPKSKGDKKQRPASCVHPQIPRSTSLGEVQNLSVSNGNTARNRRSWLPWRSFGRSTSYHENNREGASAANGSLSDDSDDYTDLLPTQCDTPQNTEDTDCSLVDVTYWMLREMGCTKEEIFAFFTDKLKPISLHGRSQEDFEMKYDKHGGKIDKILDCVKR